MYARKCPYGNCILDPGERCTDCRDKETAPDATNIESGEADHELSDPRSASILTNI